jgi:pSer/pThr/pTyr-binding forkhead associated (FHA) protein
VTGFLSGRFSATLLVDRPQDRVHPMASPPDPVTSIRLIVSGAEISLGLGDHILGRSNDCALRVDDPLASRRHAAITVTPVGVTIRDLGSRNGVLVNGDDIDKDRALVEGDLITLGSQALTVRAICRAGDARISVPPVVAEASGAPSGRQALGKIAVQKRAVPGAEIHASANTTLNQSSAVGRPSGAFRLIVEAAGRAIASNHPERAEKILEAPLLDLLATLRAGRDVEREVLDLAVQQALALCEITRELRWADYVHDLYDQMRIPMPLPVADRLALAMQKMK